MTNEERDEVKQVVQEVLQEEGVAIDDNTIFPMKNSAGQSDALLMMQLDQQHHATDYSRINAENLPGGGGGSITIDPQPTKDSSNAVASGGTFGMIQDSTNVNAIESVDGKIYNDYQAGDIFFIVDNDVRKYRVALVAGTADAEHPVTISPVNFYYALNSADAINLSLTLKTVSTEQQSLSTQQKAQARSNIATIGYEEQTLTTQQKEQAAQNIGLGVVVKGDAQQSLSDAQKVQAQNNMVGKVYDAATFSGLGKKVLAKNIQLVGGVQKNVMTQEFFQDSQSHPLTNTIFVIQYDYTLGENITIPAGCTLQFDGGSISGNYQLIDNYNTEIIASNVKIFGTDITLTGNWNIPGCIEWFGAKGDDSTDNTAAIQKALDSFNTVRIGKGTYRTGALTMSKCRMITGLPIARAYYSILKFILEENAVALQCVQTNLPYVKIDGIAFLKDGSKDNCKAISIVDTDGVHGVPIKAFACRFENWESAIVSASNSYYNLIDGCMFRECLYCLSNFNSNNLIVRDCYAENFVYFLTLRTGDGPTTIETCSFEAVGEVEAIVKGLFNENYATVNFLNNYVEIYSGTVLQGYIRRSVVLGNLFQIGGSMKHLFNITNGVSFISEGNLIDVISTEELPAELERYIVSSGLKTFIVHDSAKTDFIPENYETKNQQLSGESANIDAIDPITGIAWAVDANKVFLIKDTSTGYWYPDAAARSMNYSIDKDSVIFTGELKRRSDLVPSISLPDVLGSIVPNISHISRPTDHYIFAHTSDGSIVVLKWNLNTNDSAHYGELSLVSGDTTKDIIFDGCVVYI